MILGGATLFLEFGVNNDESQKPVSWSTPIIFSPSSSAKIQFGKQTQTQNKLCNLIDTVIRTQTHFSNCLSKLRENRLLIRSACELSPNREIMILFISFMENLHSIMGRRPVQFGSWIEFSLLE